MSDERKPPPWYRVLRNFPGKPYAALAFVVYGWLLVAVPFGIVYGVIALAGGDVDASGPGSTLLLFGTGVLWLVGGFCSQKPCSAAFEAVPLWPSMFSP